MDAIIPAAGLATRMRGIPKFLLPCDSTYNTLIEAHISALLQLCETVWIPTRPEMVLLLDSLGLAKDRVVLLPMTTDNMTQTVSKVLQIARTENFHLVMPDTYFHGEKPYATLSSSPNLVDLACWKIRDDQKGKLGQVLIHEESATDMRDKDPECNYEHSWGALTFNRELLDYADSTDPHIGYAVRNALKGGENISARIMDGKYFDCGTPSEYLNMLQEVI
jgi:choline kinase